jgi:hypothetical protein
MRLLRSMACGGGSIIHQDDSGWTTGDKQGDSGDPVDTAPPGPTIEGFRGPCPSPRPDGWIFCEDFEVGETLTESWFEVDGTWTRTSQHAASGSASLGARWDVGDTDAGTLVARFGRSPAQGGGPVYFSDDDFDEIYWVIWFKHEEGTWGGGPSRLAQITSLATASWGQGVSAYLRTDPADPGVLHASGTHCLENGEVSCVGFDDVGAMSWIASVPGEQEALSDAASGSWHCASARARLNSPGEADGQLDLWVDGIWEGEQTGIDWRGDWTEYGWNALVLQNLWTGGAPAELWRWVDDIAVATVPIGCPQATPAP